MKKNYTFKNILCVTAFLILCSINLFSQNDSVYYHDYSFESQFGSSGPSPSTDYYRYVTRFTPPYYPAKLVGIKAWFRNATDPTSNTKAVWYVDPTGAATGPGAAPGTLSITLYPNPAIGGVTDSAYSQYMDVSYANTVISSGDVYAGVTQHNQNNGFLGIAIDNQNSSTPDRPWAFAGAWYQMQSWAFVNGEWGINAYFMPVTIGVNELSNAVNMAVYPNPVSDNSVLTYDLKETTDVTIAIYSILGEKIKDIVIHEQQNAGNHSIDLSSANLKAGIYFIKLNSSVLKISRIGN